MMISAHSVVFGVYNVSFALLYFQTCMYFAVCPDAEYGLHRPLEEPQPRICPERFLFRPLPHLNGEFCMNRLSIKTGDRFQYSI